MVLDMTDPTFELANAHRWFAKHLNNQAWDLLELEQLTPTQRELMRNTAHTAWRHWWEIGDVINHQRAEYLLAHVHVALEEPAAAVHHAVRSVQLADEGGESYRAFDQVFSHDAAASAYQISGSVHEEQHQSTKIEAARALLTDQTEQRVANEWLNRRESAAN
jgi:hypothetical protein